MDTTATKEKTKLGFFETGVLFLAVSVCLPVFAVGVLVSATIVSIYTSVFERERNCK